MPSISNDQLDSILGDFSARGRPTYLDDALLGLGHAAVERDEIGVPAFSAQLPPLPVVLVERHQALWTHPDTPGPRQEVWTEQALALGMQRIRDGVVPIPNLKGWLVAERPRDEGGLQLQSPDGDLFVHTVQRPDSAWIAAAQQHGHVVVFHGPHLGLRVLADPDATLDDAAAHLLQARKDGLVSGGVMGWGQVRTG